MRVRLVQLGVSAGIALLLLVPWTVRNVETFHDPVLLSTNSAEVLVYANCNEAYHGTFFGFWVFACQKDIIDKKGLPPGDESQRANYWRQIGQDYASHHASRLPAVVAARVGRVWDLYRPFQNTEFSKIEGRPKWVSTLGLLNYWAMLPFAVGGVVALRRRKVILLPLADPGRVGHRHRGVRLWRGAVPGAGRGGPRGAGGDRHRRAASSPMAGRAGALGGLRR